VLTEDSLWPKAKTPIDILIASDGPELDASHFCTTCRDNRVSIKDTTCKLCSSAPEDTDHHVHLLLPSPL